jgi:putative membrane protein
MSFFTGRADLKVKPGIAERPETHFSWLRTRMSVERTLMSWVRTATALIGFGFTIFQFFQHLNQMSNVAAPQHPGMMGTIALGLVGTGVLALIVALMEYRATLRYLWSAEFEAIAGTRSGQQTTPAAVVAVLLGLVGLLAFGAIALRTAKA